MGLFGVFRGLLPRGGRNRPAPAPTPTPPPPVAENARLAGEWAALKAFVAWCEAERLDLRALRAGDCVGFLELRARVDEAVHAGVPLDRVARDHGFAGARHWEIVVRYFEARYSELQVDARGVRRVGFVEEYRRACALVAERARRAEEARAAEARLLEPIHGVGLERFAEVSAAIVRLGATPSRAALSRVLSELGVGAATYGAVRRGWLERIARDPTRTLQRRYTDAFLGARCRFATLAKVEELERESPSARRSWADDALATA